MRESKVKGTQVSDELYARYYLLHVFADVFANFAAEFQKRMDSERVRFSQELKRDMGQLAEHSGKLRYYASRVACGMVDQVSESDAALNDLFRNSDSVSELFTLIMDRIMAVQDGGALRLIGAYIQEHFPSTGLYPELGSDKDVERKVREGSVCDMAMSCPYFNSTAKTAGGSSYSVYYCRGMFKDCARRRARVAGQGYKDLSPDGVLLDDSTIEKVKMVVPKFVF